MMGSLRNIGNVKEKRFGKIELIFSFVFKRWILKDKKKIYCINDLLIFFD